VKKNKDDFISIVKEQTYITRPESSLIDPALRQIEEKQYETDVRKQGYENLNSVIFEIYALQGIV
jgi:hypothetical protein